MVGGPKKVFQRVEEYFHPMGKTLFYCGKQGMGLQAKLSQNLVLANMMQGFIEGMALAVKGGVDAQQMYDILDASAAKAGLISFKAPLYLCTRFSSELPPKVDAQGHWPDARLRPGVEGSPSGHLACPSALRSKHRPRPRGRGFLLGGHSARGLGRSQNQGQEIQEIVEFHEL